LASIGCPTKLMVLRDVNTWWHPGRSGKLSLGPKNILAGFGEVHPKILKEMNIKGPVMAFAIHIEKPPFPKNKTKTRPALSISDFQSVQRDFSFIVDKHIEASILENAARGADKSLIKNAYIFDQFIDPKESVYIGEDKKSLAITVHIQSSEKTLVDEEIDTVSKKIIENIIKASGGVLRG
jgi:phenylalanyl-tRNA synthetase beta chain